MKASGLRRGLALLVMLSGVAGIDAQPCPVCGTKGNCSGCLTSGITQICLEPSGSGGSPTEGACAPPDQNTESSITDMLQGAMSYLPPNWEEQRLQHSELQRNFELVRTERRNLLHMIENSHTDNYPVFERLISETIGTSLQVMDSQAPTNHLFESLGRGRARSDHPASETITIVSNTLLTFDLVIHRTDAHESESPRITTRAVTILVTRWGVIMGQTAPISISFRVTNPEEGINRVLEQLRTVLTRLEYRSEDIEYRLRVSSVSNDDLQRHGITENSFIPEPASDAATDVEKTVESHQNETSSPALHALQSTINIVQGQFLVVIRNTYSNLGHLKREINALTPLILTAEETYRAELVRVHASFADNFYRLIVKKTKSYNDLINPRDLSSSSDNSQEMSNQYLYCILESAEHLLLDVERSQAITSTEYLPEKNATDDESDEGDSEASESEENESEENDTPPPPFALRHRLLASTPHAGQSTRLSVLSVFSLQWDGALYIAITPGEQRAFDQEAQARLFRINNLESTDTASSTSDILSGFIRSQLHSSSEWRLELITQETVQLGLQDNRLFMEIKKPETEPKSLPKRRASF